MRTTPSGMRPDGTSWTVIAAMLLLILVLMALLLFTSG